MAALWMTAEDVKDDFKKFAVDNSTDWAKASWYQEIPYAEVAECAEMLYKEKFPQPEIITKGRERRQQAFMDFTEYPVFKQIVLEMVTGLDNHSSRKEFYKKLRDQDEGYNQYAFSFCCFSLMTIIITILERLSKVLRTWIFMNLSS